MEMDLGSVKVHVEGFLEVADVLHEEIIVLRKLVYKNTSQHRRAIYFQYIQHVNRLHRDIKKHEIKKLAKNIIKVLDILQVSEGMHHVSWKVLCGECKSLLDTVLRRIVELSIHFVTTMESEMKAYRALGTQYAMTYFMPFIVVMNSLLGRMFTLKQTLLVRMVEAHHCLTLAFLAQTTLSNPLYASTVAKQLQSYQLPPIVLDALELSSKSLSSKE